MTSFVAVRSGKLPSTGASIVVHYRHFRPRDTVLSDPKVSNAEGGVLQEQKIEKLVDKNLEHDISVARCPTIELDAASLPPRKAAQKLNDTSGYHGDGVRTYFEQAAVAPLLSRSEEALLATEKLEANSDWRRALFSNDFILSALVGIAQDIQSGRLRIESYLEVAPNDAERRGCLLSYLKVNLPTLQRITSFGIPELKRFLKEDIFPVRNGVGAMYSTAQEVETELVRKREHVALLLSELHLRDRCFREAQDLLECKREEVSVVWNALKSTNTESPSLVQWQNTANELNSSVGLSIEELCEYLKKVEELYTAWRSKVSLLVQSNLRWVIALSLKFHDCGLAHSDVIQAGNSGAIRAAEKFEPSRRVKFITYAKSWIQRAIKDEIAKSLSSIPVQYAVVEFQNTANAVEAALAQCFQRTPTSDEVYQEMFGELGAGGMTVTQFEVLRGRRLRPLSLDVPCSQDEGAMHFRDLLREKNELRPGAPLPEESIQHAQSVVRTALDVLANGTEREQKIAIILRLRFGIDCEEGEWTLREVARYLGSNPESVRLWEIEGKKRLSSIIRSFEEAT